MRRVRALALATVVLLLALALSTGLALGERVQRGNLIVTLDGHLSPLALPRDRPAPVSAQLRAGLQTADRSLLPRVTRIEIGLPGQAIVNTRGLPVCPLRSIRDASRAGALAACGPALVGRGKLVARVALPNQAPFSAKARILAFNSRVRGRRAVLVHVLSGRPLSAAVLPFVLRQRKGVRLGTTLVAQVPSSLGPWPRLAGFEIDFGRRFSYRGRDRSYLEASCPIPRSNTAGFFSFAKISFALAGGESISTGIPRSCRAR